MRGWICVFLFLVNACLLHAQTYNSIEQGIPDFTAHKVNSPITLDGVLDESAWDKADVLSQFSQYFPLDTINALAKTEMRIVYDDNFLYISAKCYSEGDKFIVQSLKRDYGFGSTDNISFLFDTYNDKTNCYLFGMNPYGARREALIFDGGKNRSNFDNSWDNKWDGDSKRYEDHWICEMAIPFKILRFKDGASQWRFQAYRNDTQTNEFSTWINIPREYILMDMNYMGNMQWETPLEKPGKNISIIPFVSGGITRDFEDDTQTKPNYTSAIGGDAKIALSSSLNLDLTANPDFSQVEVDRQVTNLDRFEIFFPERRQFFLENADLFGAFGSSRFNPFFSRRIGVSVDTLTGNNIQNTIYGGMRLTGKLNDRLRLGLLSMQTAAQKENDLPGYNHSLFAIEQNVFHRSSVAFIFTNKQAFNYDEFGETYEEFNRLAGLEYRLKSKNNLWTGKASLMQVYSPEDLDQKLGAMLLAEYNVRRFRAEFVNFYIGAGFNPELGFVPRKDIYMFSPEFDLRFFPQSEKVISYTLSLDTRYFYKLGGDDNPILQDFQIEEWGSSVDFVTRFKNNTRMRASIDYQNAILLEDFDPTRIQEEDIFLPAGYEFENYSFELSYNSDRRKKVYWEFQPIVQKFFGGERYGFEADITYRHLPFGTFAISTNYNHINLGDPFETADLWLVGPRLEITFTRQHFLTVFLQYNNQLENLSVNTRYQWRFAPASDFFLVYTDNYITDPANPFETRNRGIVAKLTYWLNL